ncbi:MAG: hypothetical protein LBL96_03605, partial [Clostridiales bacterium]|nr:hypothetical protein [Clostridiales bacterium]
MAKFLASTLFAHILLFTLTFTSISFSNPFLAQAANLTPKPQTPFAESFLRDCDGQHWFINAVEDILNRQGKSINSLTGKTDLADITAIGLTGQSLTGHIPPAIGNITNLR